MTCVNNYYNNNCLSSMKFESKPNSYEVFLMLEIKQNEKWSQKVKKFFKKIIKIK